MCGIFFKDNRKDYPGKLLIRKAEIRHRPYLHHRLHGGFYITDLLLQGGPVAMGWVGHPSELRWTLDG